MAALMFICGIAAFVMGWPMSGLVFMIIGLMAATT